MKIWVKFLIGSILGMIIGFLLPNNDSVLKALSWLEKFAIGVGRYTVIPVLVFSLTVAVYELRMDDQFWSIILKNILLILVSSAIVIFIGITVTMIFWPPQSRIPFDQIVTTEALSLNAGDNLLDIFPSNMLSVISTGGIYLFPACIFAFFLGLGLDYDRNYSKPVISLVDSLSRIFYHIASFFSEILGFVLIILAAFWAVHFHEIINTKGYKDLIILLGVFSIVLCFGIMPLFLYLLKPKTNPWHILYGFLGPAIAAFFSGDVNFAIPVLIRHSKENFGIRRRSSTISLSLFTTFCRCGSAMVAAVAFIVIIKSYSYLRIGMIDLFTIGIYAFLFSFVLARHPGDGAFIALAALCLTCGGGSYSAGYLILKPMAFYLAAVGAFIDIMLNSFCTYVLARTNGFIEEKNLVHFI